MKRTPGPYLQRGGQFNRKKNKQNGLYTIIRYGRLLYLLALVKIVIVTKYTYGKRLASHDCFVYIYKRNAGHNGKLYMFSYSIKE